MEKAETAHCEGAAAGSGRAVPPEPPGAPAGEPPGVPAGEPPGVPSGAAAPGPVVSSGPAAGAPVAVHTRTRQV